MGELGQPRDHLLALDGVARTLQAMGRAAEARSHWERALEHYSDADVLEVAGIRTRLAALSRPESCPFRCARRRRPITGHDRGHVWTSQGGTQAALACASAVLAAAAACAPGGATSSAAPGAAASSQATGSAAVVPVHSTLRWHPCADKLAASKAAEQQLTDRAKAYAGSCQRKYSWLLPHMTTQDSARDMDSIRAAFGVSELNYLGFSYGTYLGQVYGTLFPGHVRRMVLDSTADPTGV